MASQREWAVAFAKQAQADWRSREALLQQAEVPSCQHLHFLQMACEKLCKAHLYSRGASPRDVHEYIAKNLPIILREVYRRLRGKWPSRELYRKLREQSRNIEKLVPHAGDAPNCEYPWETADGQVHVPAEHDFGISDFARHPEILKLVPHAIKRILEDVSTRGRWKY